MNDENDVWRGIQIIAITAVAAVALGLGIGGICNTHDLRGDVTRIREQQCEREVGPDYAECMEGFE